MDSGKINLENQHIWNANARDWDAHMGADGNRWHKQLIAPSAELLLSLKKGDRLLDIGCGNGLFARRMASKGIHVTAFDFSDSNIACARAYESVNIEYIVLNATSNKDLNALKVATYQGMVCNMVLMDMPDVEPIFAHATDLLTDDGVFVFSIQHPCFNSEYVRELEEGKLQITDYINHDTSKGVAIAGQKTLQYYFHRPISYYLQLGFQYGLVVTGFMEPVFARSESSPAFEKIPPVLVVGMAKFSRK